MLNVTFFQMLYSNKVLLKQNPGSRCSGNHIFVSFYLTALTVFSSTALNIGRESELDFVLLPILLSMLHMFLSIIMTFELL